MDVIVVGCGKVGYTLAKDLTFEKGINVVVVDKKLSALEKASETIDAMLVKGNGLNADTLIEAGVGNADLVIGMMDADETNILCCVLAKRLGAKYTIARVRDPDYALDSNGFWKELGLDMIINPELQTAREISKNMRFPTVDDIDTFVGGRVELVSFRVSEAGDFLKGKSVSQIFFSKKMNILLAAVERRGELLIPNGNLVLENDDAIKVIGCPSYIMDFFALAKIDTDIIKNVAIIGASRIAYYLVSLLQSHYGGAEITIIEKNKEKCESLSEQFPRCLVIHGDGTDETLFSSEDVGNMDAVVCLTDRDEENAIIALYSLHLGIRKVIVKINQINRNLLKKLGLGSTVCAKDITSDHVVRYIRGLSGSRCSDIKTLYKITGGQDDKIEAVEFTASAQAKCLNKRLMDLKLKKGVLVGCIVRGVDIIMPTGETKIEAGDSVIVFVKDYSLLRLDDILE